MARLVVVGGGAAGMTAASVAKRRDPDTEVVVLEAGAHISFSACGMPYWLAGIVPGGDDALVVVTPEQARHERGLDVRTGTRAIGVDSAKRQVRTQKADGTEASVSYDTLIIAPGVSAKRPFAVAADRDVFTLRHLDHAIALRNRLEEARPGRVAVVGGGYVGVEMVEAFVEMGIDTTLVHSRATVLSDMLDPDMGALVTEAVRARGVDVVTEARAQGIEERDGRVTGVRLEDRTVPADLVVLAIGVTPRTQLAESAGCELGRSGAVRVTPRMETMVPHVYAAGDGVEYIHRVSGEHIFLPLALHANRAGRVAGENATGGKAKFPGVLGTAVTRFFDVEVAATGITQAHADKAGFDAVAATVEGDTRAGYFPGNADITAKMVAERGTGRVLGAQFVGGPGTGKRIDTVAAALWMEATATDLEAMDLAYAPPVSPVWDVVAIAGRFAARAARE